jgi:hypothetical protein
MWADPVRRMLPCLRALKKGDLQLLPGKIVALLDVRFQQWRAVEYIQEVTDNCKLHARQMLQYVEVGDLLLFDLGYFGFEWLDELTTAGICWVSRWREKTSYQVIHVFYQDGEIFDGLIWLGTGQAQAGCAVRLVQFRLGLILYRSSSQRGGSRTLVDARDCPLVCAPMGYRVGVFDAQRALRLTPVVEQQAECRPAATVGLPHHCPNAASEALGSGFSGRGGSF